MRLKYVYKILFILLFGGIVISCASKQVIKKEHTQSETFKPAGEQGRSVGTPDDVCVMADVMPRFKQGNHQEWIARNVKYPVEAMQKRQMGKVYIEVIIEKDGTVTKPKVIRSSGYYLLDAEGLRVVNQMPAWTPGIQKGKKVRVSYTIPINFSLTR